MTIQTLINKKTIIIGVILLILFTIIATILFNNSSNSNKVTLQYLNKEITSTSYSGDAKAKPVALYNLVIECRIINNSDKEIQIYPTNFKLQSASTTENSYGLDIIPFSTSSTIAPTSTADIKIYFHTDNSSTSSMILNFSESGDNNSNQSINIK